MTAALCRPDLQRFPDPGTDRTVFIDPLDGRQFRLTAQAVSVLDLLDGARGSSDIAAALGVGADTAPAIDDAIYRLLTMGLAIDPANAEATSDPNGVARLISAAQTMWQRWQRPGRRLRYSPPATIEFSVGNPRKLLTRLAPLTSPLAHPISQILLSAISLAGTFAFFLHWPAHRALLAERTTLTVMIEALLLTLLTTAAHELAHGVVLHRHGGTVRRMGAMLMYGSPALFCDVSQAWRLTRRRRVTVALAGVRVHLFAAGLMSLLLTALPLSADTSQLLSFAVLADLSMVVVNLVPFVKFDGYIALVGWTDIPHLRQKSMELLRYAIARAVFGAPLRPMTDNGLAGPRWTLFGAACAVTGPAIGGWALISYGPLLTAAGGRYGATVAVLVATVLLYLPIRGLLRAAKKAAESGARRARRLAGTVIVATLLAVGLSVVAVPLTSSAPFAQTAGGAYLTVDPAAIPPIGTHVELHRSGFVFADSTGAAIVCGPPTTRAFPVAAGSPLKGQTTATATKLTVPLCPLNRAAGASDGLAIIRGPRVPVASWLRAVLFTPYLHAIFTN